MTVGRYRVRVAGMLGDYGYYEPDGNDRDGVVREPEPRGRCECCGADPEVENCAAGCIAGGDE